jgi:hypothetical protein
VTDKNISAVERTWVLVAPQIQLVSHRFTTILFIAHSVFIQQIAAEAKESSYVFDEQVGLFHRREVAATRDFRPSLNIVAGGRLVTEP